MVVLLLASMHAQQDSADFASTLARAEKGDAKNQLILGLSYSLGKGVTQDHAEAASWSRKAAEQGYTRAQASLP
jgi:TPR repeat protein